MAEAVYFAVVRQHGVNSPRKFFEFLPRSFAGELVYCTRLDKLPAADALIAAPLDQLMRLYEAMRRDGTLPADNRG